ncbi:MAG: TlpA family protein disulfide reductase [Actinobacteria bacterium]|nr:TlpA family protein disulfide reductase [Actinomycetota bacterium]
MKVPRAKRVWVPIAVAAVIAVVLALWIARPRSTSIERAEIGQPLPSLAVDLKTLDGETIRLDDLEGPLLINFWASWCRPCVREFPLFSEALAEHRDLSILGVVYDDSPASAREFARSLEAGWTSVEDQEDRLARTFGVSTPPGIPQTFFIDRNRILTSRVFGEMTQERLRTELDGVL